MATHDIHNAAAPWDAERVSKLYRSMYNRLLRYGLLTGASQPLVEDCIQELFIWAFRHLDQLGTISSPERYLFQSLKRNLQQAARRQQRKRQSFLRYLEREAPPQAVPSAEHHLMDLQQLAGQRAYLQAELDKLPPHLQEVIFLRYYEGMSFVEVAEVMGVTHQVARNYATRALGRLRAQMAHLGETAILLLMLLFHGG